MGAVNQDAVVSAAEDEGLEKVERRERNEK